MRNFWTYNYTKADKATVARVFTGNISKDACEDTGNGSQLFMKKIISVILCVTLCPKILAQETQKDSIIKQTNPLPISNSAQFEGLLIGRMAGVEIYTSDGAIGGGYRYRMRGINSLSMPSEPLLVVDGILLDNSNRHAISGMTGGNYTTGNASFGMANGTRGLANFSPNDIASVEFLKGAVATAIYGSRGAMGVIVVETKKAKKGVVNVDYDLLMGTTELAQNVAAYKTDWTANEIDQWANLMNPPKPIYTEANILQYKENPLLNYTLEPFRTGSNFSQNLRLSGGGDRWGYVLSGNKQENIGHTKGTNLNAKGGFFGFNASPIKRLTLRYQLNYQEGIREQIQSGMPSIFVPNRWATDATAMPFMRYEDIKNPYSGIDNLDEYASVQRKSDFTRKITWLNIRFNPFDNLIFEATAGADQSHSYSQALFPQGATTAFNAGRLDAERETITQKTLTTKLTHHWNINEEVKVTTIVGTQYDENARNYSYGRWIALLSGKNPNDTLSYATPQKNLGFKVTPFAKNFGFYINEMVNIDEKLKLNIGTRFDQSTTFRRGFFFYPHASMNYQFRQNMNFRMAFGTAGNQPAPYLSTVAFLSTVGSGGYAGSGLVYTPESARIKNLYPEKQNEIEIGGEALLLHRKLTVNVTFFYKMFTDLLVKTTVNPALNGGVMENIGNAGQMRSYGVEFVANYKLIETKNTHWNVSLNTSTLSNKVLKLGESYAPMAGGGDNVAQIRAGYSAGSLWAGTPINAPANAPSVSLLPNGAVRVFSGNTQPKFEGSIYSNFNYKVLTVNILGGGKAGFSKYNQTGRDLANPAKRQHKEFWNLPVAELTKIYNDQSRWIQRADFFKLRQISIMLNVPKDNLELLRFVKTVQMGFVANNLRTWSKYKGGYDIEAETNGASTAGAAWAWTRGIDSWDGGLPRSYSFSLSVGF